MQQEVGFDIITNRYEPPELWFLVSTMVALLNLALLDERVQANLRAQFRARPALLFGIVVVLGSSYYLASGYWFDSPSISFVLLYCGLPSILVVDGVRRRVASSETRSWVEFAVAISLWIPVWTHLPARIAGQEPTISAIVPLFVLAYCLSVLLLLIYHNRPEFKLCLPPRLSKYSPVFAFVTVIGLGLALLGDYVDENVRPVYDQGPLWGLFILGAMPAFFVVGLGLYCAWELAHRSLAQGWLNNKLRKANRSLIAGITWSTLAFGLFFHPLHPYAFIFGIPLAFASGVLFTLVRSVPIPFIYVAVPLFALLCLRLFVQML